MILCCPYSVDTSVVDNFIEVRFFLKIILEVMSRQSEVTMFVCIVKTNFQQLRYTLTTLGHEKQLLHSG